MEVSTTDLLDASLRRIVPTDKSLFRPFDLYGVTYPGLSWIPLSEESEQGKGGCYMLRFDPGAQSNPHEHSDVEEFIVLEGELVDCDGQLFKAGDFVSYRAGSKHYSSSPNGCVIFVILRTPNRQFKQDQ